MRMRGASVAGIALVVALLGGAAPALAQVVDLEIVHTNDIHGQVYPQKAVWVDPASPPEVGGLSTLGSMIRARRAEADKAGRGFLYLDAGDIWQGTPEGNMTEGRIVVEWFNAVGLDALAIGNHEFDAGAERVGPSLAPGRFPKLAANLVEERTNELPEFAQARAMLEVRGVRVAVIGLTAPDTKLLATERATRGFRFVDPVPVARREVAAARKEGAQVVVVLSHCGAPVDRQVADAVPGIDVIVGGHTHEAQNQVSDHTGTLMHATYGKGTGLGVIELRYDPAAQAVVSKSARILDTRTADWPKDEGTETLIAHYAAEIAALVDVEIGTAPRALTRTRDHRSNALGSWLTDLMREAAGADVALTNKTGIRADVPAGSVTVRSMFQVSPFGNTITAMTLTGAELRQALEYMLTEDKLALDASGLQLRYDPARPAGQRIVYLEVAGRPLRARDRVRVATNSFLAQGGDGHATLASKRGREDTGIDVLELQKADVKRTGILDPTWEPRVAPVGVPVVR